MNEQTAGQITASPNVTLPGDAEEPPGTSCSTEPPDLFHPRVHSTNGTQRCLQTAGPNSSNARQARHPLWQDIPDALWEDWRWQRQHAVRTTAQLAELLPLPPAEITALERLESHFRTAIPPYYFSLIDVNDPHDPIRLQSVPSSQEEVNVSGVEFDDPLEEDKDSPVPGVTHRYPDRALLITTPVCSMYCRFCTRKRVTMDRDGWDAPSRDEERMIEYVRQTPQIRDVILSGGDPLTLPVAKLKWFLTELAAIDHVDMIRVGTRVPVTLPQRLFDMELVRLLQSVEKVWIQTHFNHPTEITPEAARACRNLINAGMPINNHAVLMKGVNDSVDIMRQLVCGLMKIKVRPYYLFHCDPVTGAGHFRTSVWKGIEIIEGLRGHVSGLGVPTYVVDGLHGAGKIPVMPNYLISASDDAVVLRNYEGMIFRYAPEDKATEAKHVDSIGVSKVLSGGGKPLVPADLPRQARRRKHELELAGGEVAAIELNGAVSNSIASNGAASVETTNGHSKANGHAKTNGRVNGNGHAPANGHSNGVVPASGIGPANGIGQASGKSTSKRAVMTNAIAAALAAGEPKATKPTPVRVDAPPRNDELLRRAHKPTAERPSSAGRVNASDKKS